ncbi:MAG TPA: ABC transporter permease [Spirochaetota bacterium]|nr:ABC transporter permease [Spirochaetota bacterium]
MWFVALKHIFSRKSQTILTFLAIVLGSGGYVVFSGMQLGFQQYMVDRLIERSGHINISTRDEYITAGSLSGVFFPESTVRWLNNPSGRRSSSRLSSAAAWYRMLDRNSDVVAYSPQIDEQVIVSRGNYTGTVSLVGIDPDKYLSVTNFGNDITSGSLNSLNGGSSIIFIGETLMNYLGVKVNDSITVSTSDGRVTPMKIAGTFDTGDHRTDERTIYASINTVQRVVSAAGEISEIIVKVNDFARAAEIATSWSVLSSDNVESWDQLNKDRLSMMSSQDIVRNVTTTTFILIVAFGIYNILNMVVNHKKRDIAILRSIGYDRNDTVFLFLIQGVMIGVAGGLTGMILGYAGCSYLETIRIPMGRQHMMVSWDYMIYVKGFVLVVGASIIASFFPAMAAGRFSPIEIIRGSD